MARQDDDRDQRDELDDEDEDDNTSEGASGAEDDNDHEDEDDYTPPSKEEWARVQRTLEKRQAEKRALRRKLREKDQGGNGSAGASGAAESAAEIRRQFQEESDKRFRLSEARSALKGANLVDASPEGIRRAVRLLDLDELDVDGDEVDGLEDAIADLKASMPHLFKRAAKKAPGGKVGTGTAGGKGGTGGKPKTATQKLLEQLQG